MKPATLGALLRGDLKNAMIAETPGGIEAQEAAGQRAFVANDTLPIECGYGTTREQIERMGIVFGELVDTLFVNVQLPDGWRKEATDHSMHSNLLDDHGRVRARIFYKAAFYDRRADINISRRFSYSTQSIDGWGQPCDRETTPMICVVTDCDKVIWQSKPMTPSDDIEWFKLDDHLRPQGKAWLDEYCPDWRDPLAYWEKLGWRLRLYIFCSKIFGHTCIWPVLSRLL